MSKIITQTSQDGFIINKNDKYYKVSENLFLYKFIKGNENIDVNKVFKYLKNARKYIKANKMLYINE